MVSRNVAIAVVVLVIIVVAGLAAISLYPAPTGPMTTPGPTPEDRLLIYGVADPQDTKAWFDAFKAKYPGVAVEYWNGRPAEVETKIRTEVNAKQPTADLVMITLPVQLTLLKDGFLEAYKSPQTAVYPSEFKDANGYWTAIQINPIVQVYNPKVVPTNDLPKTLDDLVDAKWKGKFTIHDVTAGTVGTQWLATLNQTLGKEKWKPWVEKLLKDIKPTKFAAFEDVGSKVGVGEYSIGLSAYAHDAIRLKNQGASLEMFQVQGLPVLATVSPVSLVKGAEHPIAAKLFIDFILSADGQKLVGNTEVRIAARPGVDAKYTADKALPGIKFVLFPNADAFNNNIKYRDYFKALYG